ncbi:MAG TPA: hypothetical protein VKT32_12700 [Chthonomonadaceae bacterium]|nr:hypothetical protein [Chthonomonadaceae bacterium]
MADKTSYEAMRLLDVLAASNRQLRNFALRLSSYPGVEKVPTTLEPIYYQLGGELSNYRGQIAGCVSANMVGGNAISWNLDVFWNEEHWLIQIYCAFYDSKTQNFNTFLSFPDKTATSFEEFLLKLEQAVAELIDTVDINEVMPVVDKSQ